MPADETSQSNDDPDNPLLDLNLDNLDETELRLIAEKVYERLRRELMQERERRGRLNQWSGWTS